MITAVKTERLEARVPVTLKRMIQRAADLQGRSLTDFVIACLGQSAHQTVRDYETMRLTAEESLRVSKLLIHPPAPNAALKKAFSLHRKTVTMQ